MFVFFILGSLKAVGVVTPAPARAAMPELTTPAPFPAHLCAAHISFSFLHICLYVLKGYLIVLDLLPPLPSVCCKGCFSCLCVSLLETEALWLTAVFPSRSLSNQQGSKTRSRRSSFYSRKWRITKSRCSGRQGNLQPSLLGHSWLRGLHMYFSNKPGLLVMWWCR